LSASPRPNGPWNQSGGDNRNPLPRATLRALARRAIVAAGRIRSEPGDQAWVKSILMPAELDLWTRQSAYEQDHAVQVARRVQRRLAPTVYASDTLWQSAALMHDVGKLQSDLSMGERVIATLASKVWGVATARRWASAATGRKRRIGLYLIHGEVGAGMIRAAGGREVIAAWAEAHQGYQDMASLGIPPIVIEALVNSDVA
jgi:hypothetical protein